VAASPLAVAAVCRDGVALLALHTSPALEPLLLPPDDGAEQEAENEMADVKLLEIDDDEYEASSKSEETTCTATNASPLLRDLPRTHRGPFRISQIDARGTALLTAGWRADCSALAARCRSIAAAEVAEYGGGSIGGSEDLGDGNGDGGGGEGGTTRHDDYIYGRGVATEAALWMARCAVSEDVRTLSCVGLLACCASAGAATTATATVDAIRSSAAGCSASGSSGMSSSSDKRTKDGTSVSASNKPGGHLYLIDPSGVIHEARAFAVGNGSGRINARLVDVDFSDLSKEEAAHRLLGIIVEEGMLDGGKKQPPSASSTSTSNNGVGSSIGGHWNLPKQTRVEIAMVDSDSSSRRKIERIRQ